MNRKKRGFMLFGIVLMCAGPYVNAIEPLPLPELKSVERSEVKKMDEKAAVDAPATQNQSVPLPAKTGQKRGVGVERAWWPHGPCSQPNPPSSCSQPKPPYTN